MRWHCRFVDVCRLSCLGHTETLWSQQILSLRLQHSSASPRHCYPVCMYNRRLRLHFTYIDSFIMVSSISGLTQLKVKGLKVCNPSQTYVVSPSICYTCMFTGVCILQISLLFHGLFFCSLWSFVNVNINAGWLTGRTSHFACHPYQCKWLPGGPSPKWSIKC